MSRKWRFIYVLLVPHELDFLAAVACTLLLCNVQNPSARSVLPSLPPRSRMDDVEATPHLIGRLSCRKKQQLAFLRLYSLAVIALVPA